MKTYITIGYYDNGSEIVYAGIDKNRAMNTDLYQNCDSFNVDVWVDGITIETYFKSMYTDAGWEHFYIKD